MPTNPTSESEELADLADVDVDAIAEDTGEPGGPGEQPPPPSRAAALPAAVRRLRIGTGRLKLNERILMVLGGILAPVGILLVILGWYGAAHTPNLYEQVPYMISGGLLGIALVFLGAFFYFTHWVTQLVKEQRAQTTVVVEALARVHDTIRTTALADTNGHRKAEAADEDEGEDVQLVATARGTMAHRPDCTVVAGKTGLREVTAEDGLLPCKLCDPYATPNSTQ